MGRAADRYVLVLFKSLIQMILTATRSGFHATTPQEYAEKLHHILTLPPDEDLAMRERARTAALLRFSEAEFVRRWDMSGWQKWLAE